MVGLHALGHAQGEGEGEGGWAGISMQNSYFQCFNSLGRRASPHILALPNSTVDVACRVRSLTSSRH